MFQIEHKLLRIPTGGRLNSWLFTQPARGVEFGTEHKSDRGRVQDLNQGSPDSKSSVVLNHSAMPPPHTLDQSQCSMNKSLCFKPMTIIGLITFSQPHLTLSLLAGSESFLCTPCFPVKNRAWFSSKNKTFIDLQLIL